MFTRKHYIAIANIMKSAKEDVDCGTSPIRAIQDIEKYLADFFAGDNPNFNYNTFFTACKLD